MFDDGSFAPGWGLRLTYVQLAVDQRGPWME